MYRPWAFEPVDEGHFCAFLVKPFEAVRSRPRPNPLAPVASWLLIETTKVHRNILDGVQCGHLVRVTLHHIPPRYSPGMSRLLLFSLFATTAAWIVILTKSSGTRIVPAKKAAAKLQEAWADHHTTA